MSFFKKFFPNKKRNSLNPNDFVHIEDDKPSSTNNDNTNANNNKRNTISSPPVHNYPQPSVIHVAPSSPSHIPSHIEHDQPSQPIISSNPLPPPKPVYTSSIQRNKVSCPYCYLSMYDQSIYTRHVNECPSRPDKQPNQPPPYNAAVSMPNLNLYHPPQPANSAPPGFIQTSPIVPSPASLSYNSLPSHNPQYMVYNQPSAPALDARPYTAPAINPRPVARIVSYGTNNQPMARQPLARNNNKWTSSSLDTSPFAVNCPYPGCGLKMEAKDFVSHANSNHSHVAQNFSCPVCPLLGYISYAVKPDTNLLQHLKSRHSDLANAAVQSQPVAKKPTTQQFDDFVYDPSQFGEDDYDPSQFDDIPFDPEELKSKIGSHYVEDTIKEYKTGWECSICYEDFEVGTTIARMDCFCVFHKKCIDDWLKKAKKCPLHKD